MSSKKNIILIFLLGTFISFASCAQNKNDLQKADKIDRADLASYKIATVAGGCFWCVEAVFERVEGVKEAISGYTGGKEKNPTYNAVASGKTSHAEAVEIYFDPKIISYKEILQIFFATHDPTTLNRQGPDVGKQYRSAIYFQDQEQKSIAQEVINQLTQEGAFSNSIVTEVVPYTQFYEAEDYHQDYYEHNPNNPYIINVTRPKIKKFEKDFKKYLKASYTSSRESN
jgi:peptide-methionine (S)-S-oxide reductase